MELVGAVLLGAVVGSAISLLSVRHRNSRRAPLPGTLDDTDGALLVLEGDRIRALSAGARSLLDVPEGVVGDTVGNVFGDSLGPVMDAGGDTVVETTGRHLRVDVYRLDDDGDRRLVCCRDVTEKRRERDRLESKVEQLEQFTSLVSHDLRNPLDVAIGRTNAVVEMLDDPELADHLSRTQDAHERMQRIIEEALTLARHGEQIGEKGPVPLETAAIDAWSHVDTDGGRLRVDTQLVVNADRSRLVHLLENLFRNAVEHGGDDVTIAVETLPDDDGFCIGDDGPGIPPDERERVFETGYSGGDGTGLGLTIVSNIARAHRWEITVGESPHGGAQFSITGVELVGEEFFED